MAKVEVRTPSVPIPNARSVAENGDVTHPGLAWNRIIIAGLSFPPETKGGFPLEKLFRGGTPGTDGQMGDGLVRVLSGDFERRIDARPAPGRDGARVKTKGTDVAKVRVELVAWSQLGLDRMQEIIRQIAPMSRTKPENRTSFEVEHPALSMCDLRHFIVKKCGIPQPTEPQGAILLAMDLIEAMPAVKRPPTRTVTQTVAAPQIQPGLQDPFGGGRSNAPGARVAATAFNTTPNSGAGPQP